MVRDFVQLEQGGKLIAFNLSLDEYIGKENDPEIGKLCAIYHSWLVNYLYTRHNRIWGAMQEWSKSYMDTKAGDPEIDLYEQGMEALEQLGLSDWTAATLSYLWAIQLTPVAETEYIKTLRCLILDGEYNAFFLPPALKPHFDETTAEN